VDAPLWQQRSYQSAAGRILGLLRRGPVTVDELADALGVSGNAVRQQLALLERDGLLQRAGLRRGPRKPAQTYALSADAELLFSRAYAPVLTQLLHVLAGRLPAAELDALMREVGRGLTPDRPRPAGTARERAEAGSALLNELGGLADVEEKDGRLLIRGAGCPLGAATHHHPEACDAVGSLLSEYVGLPLRQCCERQERPRCCFEVGTPQ
jgi:predicted ArsR family transcriptional regulator